MKISGPFFLLKNCGTSTRKRAKCPLFNDFCVPQNAWDKVGTDDRRDTGIHLRPTFLPLPGLNLAPTDMPLFTFAPTFEQYQTILERGFGPFFGRSLLVVVVSGALVLFEPDRQFEFPDFPAESVIVADESLHQIREPVRDGLILHSPELLDPSGRQREELVQMRAGEWRALGCRLNLDQPAIAGHHHPISVPGR